MLKTECFIKQNSLNSSSTEQDKNISLFSHFLKFYILEII